MDCGCTFKLNTKGRIQIDDPFALCKDCPAVWKLLGTGFTKGIFQLEKAGKQWSRRLKPESVNHIAALISIIRPGCADIKDDKGISMTEHYCRRKNNEEEVISYDQSIDDILVPTFNTIVYQEQCMKLGQRIAGFNLVEVDMLRKAIGKKDQTELAKVRDMFLAGAKKTNIISYDKVQEIWEWIAKSGKYSFNQAHALEYGLTAYVTAYLKAHFPVEFFNGYLDFAQDKTGPKEEIKELVEDCKIFDIEVLPPYLPKCNVDFEADVKNSKIWFGLGNIRGIGPTQVSKLINVVKLAETNLNTQLSQFSWMQVLIHILNMVSSTVAEALISSGALSFVKWQTRRAMLFEYKIWSDLTDLEKKWVSNNLTTNRHNLRDLLDTGATLRKYNGAAANVNRIKILQSLVALLDNPPTKHTDDINFIIMKEEDLFGTALTYSRVDCKSKDEVTHTCKDILCGFNGQATIGIEIKNTREMKIKNGKNVGQQFCFISVSDGTCVINDVVLWPEVYVNFKNLIMNGNTVTLSGKLDKKKIFVVNGVKQL